MTHTFRRFRRSILAAATLLLAAAPCVARATQPQITAPIDNASRIVLAGSRPTRALAANDIGKVPSSTQIHGITLVFRPGPAQQAALDSLVAAQQNPASPLYHQWLTPGQFAARFGMAASDIAQVQSWLQQQGFTLDSVSRSRDRISFSGSEAQVESAFGAELHYYKSGSETRFAPATDISLPSALAPVVADVTHLSSFHPRPHVIVKRSLTAAQPNFTSSQSGNYFLTPKDVATIYDVNPAYNAGYTGSNQSIAVVGQTFVYTTDIANFQSAAGLATKAPTLLLVPGSGTSAVNPNGDGDEVESDIDLEYSSAIATGANIFFVYTGNNTNYGVFDSLQYAVDQKIAPIISISYGDCEPDLGSADYAQLNAILEQAASQGQSVIAAAGDDGSTDCSGENVAAAEQEELSVDFPASSQYVTAMGGTEIPAADLTSTYFTQSTGTDVISSAKSYIPEQVWNDDVVSVENGGGLSAGGGGVSIFTPRPSWQTGVPGIPAGSFRLVPDISLDASPNDAGYLYCSSDSTYTGITGSCSNGFRDANDQSLTVAGGTSFDAPIFSGMLALISQRVDSTGQGVANPTLYSLASSPLLYSTAFHDIATGGNQCTAGVSICSTAGASEYPAATGYDEASGLGSVDLYNLLTAWPTTTGSTLAPTTTTLTAATSTPASGATDAITITVAPTAAGSAAPPTGSVSISVDGVVVNAALPLTNGTATYTFSSPTAGTNVVTATYSGDATYAPSTGSVSLNVGPAFTLSSTNLTVAAGSSGSITLTATPLNGYTGTIDVSISGGVGLNETCIIGPTTIAVSTAAPAAATYNFFTSASTCSAQGAAGISAQHRLAGVHRFAAASPPPSPFRSAPLGVGVAGLLALGFLRRRARRFRRFQPLLAVALLGLVGFGLSGCSGGGGTVVPSAGSTQATGTYSVTLTGNDSSNPAITASTTFTITVH